MKGQHLIAICMLGWVFNACRYEHSVEKYVQMVTSNTDYQREYKDGNVNVSCRYMPSEYLAIMETEGISYHTKDERERAYLKAKSDFDSSAYFLLTLALEDGTDVLTYGIKDQTEYATRLNYMTSYMGQSFFIVRSEGDTIQPMIYEFQRSYGNSPKATFLFAFPKQLTLANGDKELQFYYKDRLLGIQQVVRLTFDPDELESGQSKINFENN